MSRSSKKKPYVQEKLLKRIEEMNETEKKETQKKNFSTIIFNIFHHHRILFPSILRNSHARTTPGFSYRV